MLRWGKDKGETATPEAPQGEAGAAPPLSFPSLNELLVAEGKVSEIQMNAALALQRETGAFIGEILIKEGVLGENTLISFLAKHCRVPHLSLLDYLIDPKLLELVPMDICRQHRLLPIDKLGRNLTVAMVNPLDRAAVEAVRACCPDLRIKPILCAHQHFEIVSDRVIRERGGGKMKELSASSLGLKMDKQAAVPPEETKAAPKPPEPEAAAAPALPEASDDPFFKAPPAPRPPAVGAEEQMSETLFGKVFRGAVPLEPVALAPPPEAKPNESPMSQSGILMREMAAVMMDSMRDTYGMLARRMELFRGLDPEEVARIFARGITEEFTAGQPVFAKGDAGNKLYVILGGEIQIHDGDRDIATLARGETFGEMALMSLEPRSASARATQAASLLAISRETIRELMPPEVSLQLLSNLIVTLSARLRRANID